MFETEPERTREIARLNDRARQEGRPHLAGLFVTPGVRALPMEEMNELLGIVRQYSNWTGGDDPYGEHDYGVLYKVERNGLTAWTQEPQSERPNNGVLETAVFKIDYYAKGSREWGSERPWLESETDRVMTVMLSWEQ